MERERDERIDEHGNLRDPAFPSMLAMLYQMLRPRALELGYALALHGSLARDLDVVAIPWTDEAVSGEELAAALCKHIDGFIAEDHYPSAKPHGRRAWSLHLVGTGSYIDLSVMPLQPEDDR